MPIQLDSPAAQGLPVVKRQRIGDHFIGALVEYQARDVLKNGQRVINDKTGKPRQELVAVLVAMPGTNCVAGIGDSGDNAIQPGDHVRLILRGRAFADWIESKGKLPAIQGVSAGAAGVGDIVEQTVDHAQQYDANGNPVGGKIHDQATADRVPRGQSLGFYGPLTVRRASPVETQYVTLAEQAYHDRKARISIDTAVNDQEPF